MRLDNVVIRIRDTRVYVDFTTGQVIRDYTEKEDDFEKVKRVSRIFCRSVYIFKSYCPFQSPFLFPFRWSCCVNSARHTPL